MTTREHLNELIARERQMFHLVWNADVPKVQSVLEHGLERVKSNYRDFWESRPNHIYLGRADYVHQIFLKNVPDGRAYVKNVGEADWALFAVDLKHLEPEKLNPNEDHFHWYESEKARQATQRFRLPLSPCQWAWDCAKYLKIATPASLGEWADAIDLGSDPETTRYSAERGSVAYRGVVPAHALRVVKANFSLEALAS